jgi:two-component system cell cycle response regulator
VSHFALPATILIVEDNPINMLLAQAQLKQAGYSTIAASSAEAAQKLIDVCLPDLLLLDIRLPGMSGIEFATHLRSQPTTSKLPIIALTAQAMPDDLIAASGAGFDAYLTKPVERTQLFSAILRALADR